MSLHCNGELVPEGGGDNIPLIRDTLTIGRRENCDICLRYPNVSGTHCELTFVEGFWRIRDCNSTNGIKVNGAKVTEKRLLPGEKITIGKKSFAIEYQVPAGMQTAQDSANMEDEDILSKSLLERAGLVKPGSEGRRHGQGKSKDIDPLDALGKDENDG